MGWKLFGQIILLILIGVLILMLVKCAIRKCPILGKQMKSCCQGMQKAK